jgi:hypothetical protein
MAKLVAKVEASKKLKQQRRKILANVDSLKNSRRKTKGLLIYLSMKSDDFGVELKVI